MNALEELQHRGPLNKTPESYDKWYADILKIANAMYGHSIAIKGELDTEMAETVGNYDAKSRTWSHDHHRKLVDLTEEL